MPTYISENSSDIDCTGLKASDAKHTKFYHNSNKSYLQKKCASNLVHERSLLEVHYTPFSTLEWKTSDTSSNFPELLAFLKKKHWNQSINFGSIWRSPFGNACCT